MRVVIAGGGTAGHVNPAIALAQALGGAEISFIGTRTGVESNLVPRAGFTLETIEVAGFDRARPLSFVPTAMRAAGAIFAARSILARRDPDVVVGVGGYVSLPVGMAAASRKIPLVLHEQNIVLGLANKVCKRWAKKVALSFADTLEAVGDKGVVTGNPVVREIATADLARERGNAYERFSLDPARTTLLVFGGSQGAKRINDAAGGLATLWRDRSDLQVLHITGAAHEADVRSRVEGAGGDLLYRVVPFVDRMVSAYAVADLAVCRGGATTVAELGVTGLPAIVVPYPHHRDMQQERHGRVLETAGAAVLMRDEEVDTDSLGETAAGLLGDPDRLVAMKAEAASIGHPEAAQELAQLVKEAAR